MWYWILFIGIAIVSWLVQKNLDNKFKEYSKIPVIMTGKQVAEKMLHDYGITDVNVLSTRGSLTDHYNPVNKTLNLSDDVYNVASVAAAAVAAHECGHALQHKFGYAPLTLRSKLVPAVNFSSKLVTIVLLVGMLLIKSFPQIMLLGIILFGVTTLFSIVTLPVEIDASKRALAWLDHSGLTSGVTQKKAESALKAAAYTYVIAAVSSLATLLYYIAIFMGGRNR